MTLTKENKPVSFQDLSWMDVESYLQQDDRVAVITGACEQHGYLSLLTDTRIPVEIARRACSREGVLFTPPVPYGISHVFSAYPGTLSLSPETYLAVMRDLIEGLLAQGFRRVLVSNGHGGNTALLKILLGMLCDQHPDARFGLFVWWEHPKVKEVEKETELVSDHANWCENFSFIRVRAIPTGEKEAVILPAIAPSTEYRAVIGDGSFGGPYQASDETMERMLAAAVSGMVEALQEL
jgi:creatinine amidohydrolase